jgi:hypothetical protein
MVPSPHPGCVRATTLSLSRAVLMRTRRGRAAAPAGRRPRRRRPPRPPSGSSCWTPWRGSAAFRPSNGAARSATWPRSAPPFTDSSSRCQTGRPPRPRGPNPGPDRRRCQACHRSDPRQPRPLACAEHKLSARAQRRDGYMPPWAVRRRVGAAPRRSPSDEVSPPRSFRSTPLELGRFSGPPRPMHWKMS